MTTTSTRRLTLINTTAGDVAEYAIMNGEHAWGWIGRIVIDGTFHGFQLVHWGAELRTTRMATWARVHNWVTSADTARHLTQGWLVCEDLYAEDTLAAYEQVVREQAAEAAAAEQARADEQAAAAQLVADRAAAVDGHATVRYHGSMGANHGVGRVLRWCDCDECRGLTDRVEVSVQGQHMVHVRWGSITLV